MKTKSLLGCVVLVVPLLFAPGCGSKADHEVTSVMKDIDGLNAALGEYRAKNGAFPTGTTEQVYAELGRAELKDPWGTVYRISRPEGFPVEVRSAGPDHTFGTDDDITPP